MSTVYRAHHTHLLTLQKKIEEVERQLEDHPDDPVLVTLHDYLIAESVDDKELALAINVNFEGYDYERHAE